MQDGSDALLNGMDNNHVPLYGYKYIDITGIHSGINFLGESDRGRGAGGCSV